MNTSPPTVKLGITLILLACCMAVLVHLHPERLKAPEWVAYLMLGVFGFGGICIVAQALRLHGLARWLVCVLLAGMTLIPSWIALGSGARQCSTGGLTMRTAVSEATCRGAFGVGACILAVMFIIAVRGALRARHMGE